MTEAPSIWAVVPIKDFAHAKQRLATAFSPEFRRRLVPLMVEDVLAALAGANSLAGILVVTIDPEATRLALRYGAEVSADGALDGHTGAVTAGGRTLMQAGVAGMLSVPGDIPGITSAEVDAVIAAHCAPGRPRRAFTVVPAHDERGSNGIMATPPDVVPLAYGNDSFLPHLASARSRGLDPLVLPQPGIGMDVDNPQDLLALFAKNWPTRTHDFLKSSDAFAAVAARGLSLADGHPTS